MQNVLNFTLKKTVYNTIRNQLQQLIAKRKYLEEVQSSLEPDEPSLLLKLNIGGKKYDVLREVMVQNPIGWNLFFVLCELRWEKYLLKDKQGRIYLDMDSEIVLILLDQIQEAKGKLNGGIEWDKVLNVLSVPTLSPPILTRYFQFLNDFNCRQLGEDRATEYIIGLTSSTMKLWKNRDTLRNFFNLVNNHIPCQKLHFKLLHKDEANNKQSRSSKGYKFQNIKSVAIFAQDSIGNVFGGICKYNLSSCKDSIYVCFRYDATKHSWTSFQTHTCKFDRENSIILFGKEKVLIDTKISNNNYFVPVKHFDPNDDEDEDEDDDDYETFNWTQLEIFSFAHVDLPQPVNTVMNTTSFLERLKETYNKKKCDVRTTATITSLRQCCDEEFNELEELEKEMQEMMALVRSDLCTFLDELLFVERYLHSQQKLIEGTFNEELENNVDTSILRDDIDENEGMESDKANSVDNNDIFTTINTTLQRIQAFPIHTTPTENHIDPLLYFNVNGERLCLLKESLLKVFPHCQLAARASGSWTPQPWEIDEDGSWYINYVNPRLFRQLVEFIRAQARVGSEDTEGFMFGMTINPEDEIEMKAMLDYLNIETVELTVR